MLSKRAASIYVKQACSRTIQTSGPNRFVRGAHHRRCAREGLIEVIMPDAGPSCKAPGGEDGPPDVASRLFLFGQRRPAAAVCSRRNKRSRQLIAAILKFPHKTPVSPSHASVLDEGCYNHVAVNRASHADRRSVGYGQCLSVLEELLTFSRELFSLLVDLQAEADLHVVEGFVSRVLYGVDDVPFAREVLRIGGVLLGFGCSNLLHFGLRVRFSNRGRL